MTLALNALQAAVYTRLTGQMATPVYDFVPQSAAFPYVVLGEFSAVPSDTKNKDGQEITLQVHTFAKGAGKKSAATIMEAIHLALHDQPSSLTLSGYGVTVLRVEFTQLFREPGFDGESDHYHHGVQRVRAIVHTN